VGWLNMLMTRPMNA